MKIRYAQNAANLYSSFHSTITQRLDSKFITSVKRKETINRLEQALHPNLQEENSELIMFTCMIYNIFKILLFLNGETLEELNILL